MDDDNYKRAMLAVRIAELGLLESISKNLSIIATAQGRHGASDPDWKSTGLLIDSASKLSEKWA